MTSTKTHIEASYDVSNDFFALWLDDHMHYTSASFLTGEETLVEAQEQKCRILSDYAELDESSSVLDIGCGWGSYLAHAIRERNVKKADGITLSTAQHEYAQARGISGLNTMVADYHDFVPEAPYDGLVSIEMIDHLCSPAQARRGEAVDLYRKYFTRVAQWVKPGAYFGFQAILRNRVPRDRKSLEDLAFTADVIFPGGLNPRLEELIKAVEPSWEVLEVRTQRESYGRTTAAWHDGLVKNESVIRETWGDQVYEDYDRYLGTCVRAFEKRWSSDVQMKLRRN
ncbi:MAG: class I SAM-dependent methyltransferase [Myxococcota bacterium]